VWGVYSMSRRDETSKRFFEEEGQGGRLLFVLEFN
jgi:hypothetical protein